MVQSWSTNRRHTTQRAFGSHPRRVFSISYPLTGFFHGDTSNPQRPTSIVKFLGPPRPAPTTPLASFVSREPESGNIVSGVFTPVLAKHSKSFSLIDCISVGVDRMQRNFEPMRKQVEAWQRSELTDVTAKVVIYEAFVEGKLEAPKHLARTVHDLYFEPKYEEFRPRTIWSLSNAFTSAFKELEPIPQFKATAKLGEFLEARFSQTF
jgi:hypothetical protein